MLALQPQLVTDTSQNSLVFMRLLKGHLRVDLGGLVHWNLLSRDSLLLVLWFRVNNLLLALLLRMNDLLLVLLRVQGLLFVQLRWNFLASPCGTATGMNVAFGRSTELINAIMAVKEQGLSIIEENPGCACSKNHFSSLTSGTTQDESIQIQRIRFPLAKVLCAFQKNHWVLSKASNTILAAEENALTAKKFHKEIRL